MRCLSLLMLILISTIVFGCSKRNMVSTPAVPEVQDCDTELVVIETGRMNLETTALETTRDVTE